MRTGPEGTEPIDFTLADRLFREVEDYWREKTGALWFDTPDQALDRYLNGWAPYQIIACRLFGRTSLYQNGGAFGFRDQLQDVCAVLPIVPELARAQILRACAHQYREGDVMHWWHPGQNGAPDKGVRTRISDDLLWLPYALCEYLDQTGDRSLLNEQVEFLVSNVLAEGERERYEEPARSEERAAVLEHALRAADRVLDRGFGVHGLALMGTGDWNDGMDLVGAGGSGESVWLTWFLGLVLRRLLPLCGEARSERYQAALAACARAANAAWDGEWFLRAYDDFGKKMGSHECEEGKIFIEPQGFAVMGGVGKETGADLKALESVDKYLNSTHGLVLNQPAFTKYYIEYGEISTYPAGYKENAGIFCHNNAWIICAEAFVGHGDKAFEYYSKIAPAYREEKYSDLHRTEPYVYAQMIAGKDAKRHGEAKNSWLTGTAAWNFVAVSQYILGVIPDWDGLKIDPSIPHEWDGFTISRQFRGATYDVTVKNPNHVCKGVVSVTVDGKAIEGNVLPVFSDGKSHAVEVVMG